MAMNKEKNTFIISLISDTHLLARDLMSDSKDFITFTKFDRKLLVESEALLRRSLELIDEKNSKYILITGDLTKDGEKISHLEVAKILKEWKDKDKSREIFILPGNHDINNRDAFDFSKKQRAENIAPKDFLDIYNFAYNNSHILELYKDSQIFKTYLEKINQKYDREEKYSYYAHGYCSFAARIESNSADKNGLTIIGLDTSIYSCDRESRNKDGRTNVPGSIVESQMIWACNKIEEAKKRKDLIIFATHHSIVPNFRNRKMVLSPFLIKEWRDEYKSLDPRLNGKNPAEVLADMGVKFVFSGHLHENGSVKYVSKNKNEILNIQTGSPVTYPLPIKYIRITDDVDEFNGFGLDVKTKIIKDFKFTNIKGEKVTVANASLYTLENQLSLDDVLFNYIKTQANKPEIYNVDFKKLLLARLGQKFKLDLPQKGYVNELMTQALKYFPIKYKGLMTVEITVVGSEFAFLIKSLGSRILIKASNLEQACENLIKQVEDKVITTENIINHYELITRKYLSMPLGDKSGKTVYDFANYIYQYKPLDENERPQYVDDFINKITDPDFNIIDTVLDYTADELNEVYDRVTSSIKFEKNGSKKEFFSSLIERKGLVSKFILNYLYKNLNTLEDLFDLIGRYKFGKKNIRGIDVAKYIFHHQNFKRGKVNFSKKMFGTRSLRKYVISLVEFMNNDILDLYENEDYNELEHYFTYVDED
jgi:3',5'-cyclic AMP phosphodiesterase CpdA